MKLLTILTTFLMICNTMSFQERWWSSIKPYFSKDVDVWHIPEKDKSTDKWIRQTSYKNETTYRCDDPPTDHAVYQLFSLQNFPTNDQNTRRNQAAQACIEAIGTLVDSLAAVNSMDDDPRISSSFLRYFESQHVSEVRLVIESLVRQLGAEIFPGAQQCIPRHELLPLIIHYDFSPQTPSLCEGTLLALPEVLDSSGEPIEPIVQYMIICPRWFEKGRWRLIDGVSKDLQGYRATEYGDAALAGQVGAGLDNASTDIVHELLHWWSFLGNFANAVIDDEAFRLEDLGFDQDTQVRTPWLAMHLKMRRPRLCTSNDENYMWFIREAFHTRRWDRPGQWWDPPQDMSQETLT